MKLLLALLLLPLCSYGQWYNIDHDKNFRFVSVGLDPAQAIYGSPKNSNGFDGVIKVGANHGRIRVSIFYERFELIQYQSFGFQPSVVFSPYRNIKLLLGTEVSMINRMGPTSMSYAFNSQVEYHLKRFFIYAQADLKRRTDVTQKWGYSNYIGIGFKF